MQQLDEYLAQLSATPGNQSLFVAAQELVETLRIFTEQIMSRGDFSAFRSEWEQRWADRVRRLAQDYQDEVDAFLRDFPRYKKYLQLNNQLNETLLSQLENDQVAAQLVIELRRLLMALDENLKTTRYVEFLNDFQAQAADAVSLNDGYQRIQEEKANVLSSLMQVKSNVYAIVNQCLASGFNEALCLDSSFNTGLTSYLPATSSEVAGLLQSLAELAEEEYQFLANFYQSKQYKELYAKYEGLAERELSRINSSITAAQEDYVNAVYAIPEVATATTDIRKELDPLSEELAALVEGQSGEASGGNPASTGGTSGGGGGASSPLWLICLLAIARRRRKARDRSLLPRCINLQNHHPYSPVIASVRPGSGIFAGIA